MTEPDPPCTRGCVRDCRCDACLTAPTPVHDPVPIPAVDGWLCRTCSKRLARWLETILEDTLTLSTRIPDNYAMDHGHTHAKVSGSPALIRLDVAALTDPRTLMDSDDTPGEPVYIIGKVSGWAGLLAEEWDMASSTNTMGDSVGFLIRQWDRLTAAQWIDEFYADMATIRQLLNRAHNRRPPLPRGHCFTCNTQLWQEDGNGLDTVTCPKCQRVYDHLGLVKLKLQTDRERERQPVESEPSTGQ